MDGWCDECGTILVNDAGAVIMKRGKVLRYLCLDCADKKARKEKAIETLEKILECDKLSLACECSLECVDCEYLLNITEREDAFKEAIETLKESLSDNKWIPWGKRYPRNGQYILVTLNSKSIRGEVDNQVIVCKYDHGDENWVNVIPEVILAWQPLPLPYEPKGGDTE